MRRGLVFVKRVLLLLSAIALGLAPAAAQGQSCESYAETAKFVGTFPAIPSPELVESDGGWVYTCGGGTFAVVDVTRPAAPALHGSLGGLGTVADFAVAGSRAYLARGTAGLAVIDLADPALPGLAGTLVLPTSATAIGMYGALVVVAGEGSLYVVDPTAPEAMAIVGQTTTVEATDLAVVGAHVLVTSATGIATIDLTTPPAPVQVALFVAACPGGACEYADPEFRGISVEGDRALVRGEKWVLVEFDPHWSEYLLNPWLWILDVSDPTALSHVSDRADPHSGARALLLRGEHAVVLGRHGWLDVLAPETLAVEGTVQGSAALSGAAWPSNYLYAGAGIAGLAVFNLTHPRTILTVSTYGGGPDLSPGYLGHCGISGQYSLETSYWGSSSWSSVSWQVWNLGNPFCPAVRLWGRVDADEHDDPGFHFTGLSGDLLAFEFRDSYSGHRYSIYDMAQANPAQASVDFDAETYDSVQLVGEIAWARIDANYELYDCGALPACPRVGQLLDPPGPLHVNGGACLLDQTNLILTALDLSDPCTPVVGGQWPLPAAVRVCRLRDGLAYLLYAGRLQIVDLRDPQNPSLLSDLSGILNASTMTIEANRLVVQTAAAFQVISIADPAHPLVLSPVTNTVPNGAIGPAVISGDRMYQGFASGVSVYDLTNPAAPRYLSSARSIGGQAYLGTQSVVVPGAFYPLDCGHPLPAFFSDFHVTRADRQVLVQWRSRGSAEDFRVEARHGADTWDVPITVQDDQLTARDSSARLSAGGEVIYTLLARLDGRWSQIAQETVALGGVPAAVRLTGASPNPFNPRTTVTFALDRPREIELAVYDLRGRRLAVLAGGRWDAGEHRLTWDGLDGGGAPLASGEYLLRLDADDGAVVRAAKVTLLR